MKAMKVALALGLLLGGVNARATYFATAPNNDYYIALDNGVVYIYHAAFVAPCVWGRVEIRDSAPFSNDYAKRLTAAIYMAKAAGKNVTFVWNDATAPTCILNSITMSP